MIHIIAGGGGILFVWVVFFFCFFLFVFFFPFSFFVIYIYRSRTDAVVVRQCVVFLEESTIETNQRETTLIIKPDDCSFLYVIMFHVHCAPQWHSRSERQTANS